MPSVADLRLPASPLADPLSYPGHSIDGNYLWLDTWLYDLHLRDDCVGAALDDRTGPGRWSIGVDGGPLTSDGTTAGTAAGLDDALAQLGASAPADRHPVLAFGSNGSPAQLQAKFASLDRAHRVVPVLRGTVDGLGLSHSPHVSPAGYVPWVLVRSDGSTDLRVFVLWLDEVQLEVLNRTEPNYTLSIVEGYPVTVESGVTVPRYRAYRGRWGALRWSSDTAPVTASTQPRILETLCAAGWFAALVGTGDPAAVVRRLGDDPDLRLTVRQELAARGFAVDDGLGAAEMLRP